MSSRLFDCSSSDFFETQKDNAFYVLKTGKEGASFLEKQNKLAASQTYKQLEKAGLKPGQIVWDVGCGTGCMTEYLA